MPRILAFTLSAMALFSTSVRADLVVLQYHHVSDSTPPATSTSVSLFEAQLEMIDDLGLEVVPLLSGTRTALQESNEANAIALTFDDAYDSVYTTAAPILASRSYPYTVFVNTNAVGRPGYMTWDQLEELAGREGVTLANHSTDHGHLPRKPGESSRQWQKRVQESLDGAQQELRQRLDINTPMFAYPYGEFDAALEAHLSDRGWYGYSQHSGAIGIHSAPTRLPRFPMADAYGQLDSLENKLLSRAFPVEAEDLPDGVITRNPPILEFALDDPLTVSGLNCFASGMGRIAVNATDDGRARVQAPEAFDSRRFRYNCTHPADDGRFYWLSQPWLDLSQPED
ncbi:polysaccharide deacetylase family protein [Marinobacter pelagius]|uniref:polysaccharide deacetylase family protein n=1 Tax=Marinobacter sp. C7 TaxID=2951363 RepID=UPI001EF05136|nr:polysaccharide deacetylase family protein [Marinobacter sp. C7]MCG7199339.1 polysaccharide deacetylase family protein [Marinobacter sp. C7]